KAFRHVWSRCVPTRLDNAARWIPRHCSLWGLLCFHVSIPLVGEVSFSGWVSGVRALPASVLGTRFGDCARVLEPPNDRCEERDLVSFGVAGEAKTDTTHLSPPSGQTRMECWKPWQQTGGMPKRVLIIDGHPDSRTGRYVHALAKAYFDGAHLGGHEVRSIIVSEMEFPLLRTGS